MPTPSAAAEDQMSLKGGDTTLSTCSEEIGNLGAISFVVPVQGEPVEVLRLEGGGPVYAFGQKAEHDPLVFAAFRDWHHSCPGAPIHDRRASLTYSSGAGVGGAPAGWVRFEISGRNSAELEFGERDGELEVRIAGYSLSLTPGPAFFRDVDAVFRTFKKWLQDACLRHFAKEETT